MDAINNIQSKRSTMFENQSPITLYVSFFVLTIIFLIIKYQILTSSIIMPKNIADKWRFKKNRTTFLNVFYLLLIIGSQIGLVLMNTNEMCGDLNNAPFIIAKVGTAWGIIFTMIFIIISPGSYC